MGVFSTEISLKIERGLSVENFVGNAAGILMIALIVVLFWTFLMELSVPVTEKTKVLVKRYALICAGFIFVQMLAAGIMYNFYASDDARANLFNLTAIWKSGAYEYGSIPSIFYLLRGLFALALFGKVEACGLYIGLLCAVITSVTAGLILNDMYDEDKAGKLYIFYMCLPGAYVMFLPAPYAMFLAFFMLYIYSAGKGKKILAVIFALLSVAAHLAGIITICLLIADLLFNNISEKYKELATFIACACGQLIALLVCVAAYRGMGAVLWFGLLFPGVCLMGKSDFIMRDEIYKPLIAVVVLISGFCLMCNINL